MVTKELDNFNFYQSLNETSFESFIITSTEKELELVNDLNLFRTPFKSGNIKEKITIELFFKLLQLV